VRILRIYPFLPPLQGGMEKHILRLTEEQRKLGCEVALAFNQGRLTSDGDICVITGINLRNTKPQFVRDLLFYCALIIRLIKMNTYFDVVHVHGDWSAFLLGRLVASLVRAKKCVASIHGIARRGLWMWVYRLVFKEYAVVYATGLNDARYLGSIIDNPVYWQHSGIDADFISAMNLQERTFDIISVGSFVQVKNMELVIQIAAEMPARTFLMIGDGPLRAPLEADCRRRNLSNVTFTGQLVPADVAKYLRSAKIFLITSFTEGTPTALLEAMACGLTIVTSRSNNYDELLTVGKNGYVIEGFQAKDYVSKIGELLDDSSLLYEISCHNSEQAMNYNWPVVAKRITEWMRTDANTH